MPQEKQSPSSTGGQEVRFEFCPAGVCKISAFDRFAQVAAVGDGLLVVGDAPCI